MAGLVARPLLLPVLLLVVFVLCGCVGVLDESVLEYAENAITDTRVVSILSTPNRNSVFTFHTLMSPSSEPVMSLRPRV